MFKKVVYTLIAFVIFLVLLEGTARLFEAGLTEDTAGQIESPGWQAEFFGKLLDWHEPDPYLLWRFKANLNNPLINTNLRHFLGPDFESPKPPQTFRIVILGDSSPVGLGLKRREQTFEHKLRQMLQQKYTGVKNIEVVNAAVPGYTSEQIKVFCERELFKLEPDLVVLYCGNNDASISGYYSDREIIGAQEFQRARKILADFSFYRLANSLLSRDSKPGEEKDLVIRVTGEEYAENLDRIARMCRSQDCPLIILKPPVPYLWPAAVQFKIFSHITGEDNRGVMPEALREVLGRPIKYANGLLLLQQIMSIDHSNDINSNESDGFVGEVMRSLYKGNMTSQEAWAIIDSADILGYDIDPILLNNATITLYENTHSSEIEACNKAYRIFIDQRDISDPLVSSAASVFLYNMGVLELNREHIESSFPLRSGTLYNQWLDSALQMDYLSLRIKKEYWDAIDSAEENDSLPVIDLPGAFRAENYETLFIDHCHPTERGHEIIADSLYALIMRKYTP